MKNTRIAFMVLVVVAATCNGISAQDFETNSMAQDESLQDTQAAVAQQAQEYTSQEHEVQIDPKTGFPMIMDKPFIVFNEGVTTSWITRIQEQNGRSNFVFKDFLAGAFFTVETKNMQPLDSFLRVAVYYPLSYKFNDVPQAPKNMLNFAFDIFAAPIFRFNMWEYVRINLGAGLHFLYQMGDRWNYVNLGAGGVATVELPLARRWTILLNGYASIDYGNFGTNRNMEPYNYVWQYQLDIGVRYSRRAENQYSYIKSRKQ